MSFGVTPNSPREASGGRSVRWPRLALEASLVFLFALAIRALSIGDEALHDELYHYLAASNYLDDGTLRIGMGDPYLRASWFTNMIIPCIFLIGLKESH